MDPADAGLAQLPQTVPECRAVIALLIARVKLLGCNFAAVIASAARSLDITHKFTRAYRPQTNGKAERFIQSALREWAYGWTYQHSTVPKRWPPGSTTATGIDHTVLCLTPMHAKAGLIKSIIADVHAAIRHVKAAAQQLQRLAR